MTFKNALWAAGFPEREDGIVSGQLGSDAYARITGLPNQTLQSGSVRIEGSGVAGHLLVTAKADTDVLTAVITIAGSSAAAADLTGRVLTVSLPTTAIRRDLKTAIDGLTGAPFTTRYVGGAGANDAMTPGTFRYTFEPRIERNSLMLEISADRDVFVFRGSSAPSDNTASVLLPQDRVVRVELVRNERLFLRRSASQNTRYSVRAWIRE